MKYKNKSGIYILIRCEIFTLVDKRFLIKYNKDKRWIWREINENVRTVSNEMFLNDFDICEEIYCDGGVDVFVFGEDYSQREFRWRV